MSTGRPGVSMNQGRSTVRDFTFIAFGVLVAAAFSPAAVWGQTSATEEWEAPHERGVELYRQANYATAVAEFERAQQLGAPAANLYNLARCYERLGRIGDAIRVFEQYLSASAITPERRERATELHAALVSGNGQVRITSDPVGAEVAIDGRLSDPLLVTPTEVWLGPGAHRLELRLEGHQSATRQIDVEAGVPRAGAQVVDSLPLRTKIPSMTEREALPGPGWFSD